MISIGSYVLLLILVSLFAYIVFSSEKKEKRDSEDPRRDKDEERIRICPRCGSRDIEPDTNTYKAAAEFGGKLYYRCRTCGFIAPTFPLMTREEAEEYEKEMEKS